VWRVQQQLIALHTSSRLLTCILHTNNNQNNINVFINKAIVDIRLPPCCAITLLTSRPITDSSNACNQASARHYVPLHDQSNSQLLMVVGLSGQCFPPPTSPLTFRGQSPPRNTLFHRSSPLIIPNKQHLDRFSHFCMGPRCHAVQCIVIGKENPQNCPFQKFVTLMEDRSTAIGNVRKN